MPRFPTRTLVLMTLALFAFGWMWWRTHALATAPRHLPMQVMVLIDAGTP